MKTMWSLVFMTSFSIGALVADASARADDAKKVTFMTRNLYLGADLVPAINAIIAGDPNEIVAEVGAAWANVRATDFPARAVAIADEVKAQKPDFLALQECALWSVGAPFDPAPADVVVYDFLAILQHALEARGMHYDVVAAISGFTAEVPGYVPDSTYGFLDVSLMDRDVLLARHDVSSTISNASGNTFDNLLTFDTPLGPIDVTRGWLQADVTMGQREFRIVSTHLENYAGYYRELQAAEVLDKPCDTSLPVVVIGDFNSDGNGGASGAAYQEFQDAGFGDAWLDVHPDDPGITFGQEPTLTVASFPSTTTEPIERIDFVLYRGEFTTDHMDLFGETVAEMFDGLWPSDHAGVAANLWVR
jgi:endonuclease/exonuclease/phosphatase family protein